MRLIDADVLIRDLTAMQTQYDAIALGGMIRALKGAPTIEAVPVVHGMEILNRLEHETFSAEVYNDDFDGVEIKNLLCLGDVAEVLDEMGLLDGKEKKHETN